jgi:hypothetical protein
LLLPSSTLPFRPYLDISISFLVSRTTFLSTSLALSSSSFSSLQQVISRSDPKESEEKS